MIVIADVTPKASAQFNFNLDPRNVMEAPGIIHQGRANILYGDGHVVPHSPKEVVLYNLTTGFFYYKGTANWNNVATQWNANALP